MRFLGSIHIMLVYPNKLTTDFEQNSMLEENLAARVSLTQRFLSLLVTLLSSAILPVAAQNFSYDRDDIDVSYAYAAVMGMGIYKIDGRDIAMIRLPFSWTQRKMGETEAGLKWSIPVTIGQVTAPASVFLKPELIFEK